MRTIFILFLLFLISCNNNPVTEDKELDHFFTENHVFGSFALFDNGTGKFVVHNFLRYRDSSYLPASTFKIVNSLIGLQTGVITNDSMVIKWDKIKRENENWNHDLNWYTAFRISCVPYFQEVARRIGKDTMQRWLNTLKYGAKSDTSKIVIPNIDTFWLDNSLKITADQQLGLVKKLYFNNLKPFFKTYQEIVKHAMLFESESKYQLSYKTGLAYNSNGNKLAWVTGWIEENGHPYFYVLNVETPDKSSPLVEIRMKMLKSILSYLGFFKGEK